MGVIRIGKMLSMSDLKSLYSKMWIDSIDRFKSNNCETDLLINDPTDMRRGITILSYFNNSVEVEVSNFLEELKIIEPDQYYYPKNELHLTILSIISCITGFKLSNINVETKKSNKVLGNDRIKHKSIQPLCVPVHALPGLSVLPTPSSV